MNRSVPLWFLLFCLLLFALFLVVFGWSVKSTVQGNYRSGAFGKAAVQVASFPTLAKDSVQQMLSYSSGDFRDESIRVRREPGADYSGFAPIPAEAGIEVPGLLMRA